MHFRWIFGDLGAIYTPILWLKRGSRVVKNQAVTLFDAKKMIFEPWNAILGRFGKIDFSMIFDRF